MMLSLDEARRHVLARVQVLQAIEMPLDDAWGLVIAEDIYARDRLPRFDNSAMDGYAVQSGDVATATSSDPVELALVGEVRAAGGVAPRVASGQAVRVATGAAVPSGADAVVPVEEADEQDAVVRVRAAAPAGRHIRLGGEDLDRGDLAVAGGDALGAGESALLAALGQHRVSVRPRPRVGLLVTGDELVPPDAVAGPGQIYDSNSTALRALVREGGGEVTFLERIPDDDIATRSAIERGSARSDFLVSCGGVSVGPYDRVKDAVAASGSVDHWRVAMQPGKPVVIGNVQETAFLGLPGNPVSVHVTFEQLARPALRKMAGYKRLLRPTMLARLATPLQKPPGRRQFVRIRLSSDEGREWTAEPTGPQGSHIQSSLVDCHGVAVLSEEQEEMHPGEWLTVEVWRLPER